MVYENGVAVLVVLEVALKRGRDELVPDELTELCALAKSNIYITDEKLAQRLGYETRHGIEHALKPLQIKKSIYDKAVKVNLGTNALEQVIYFTRDETSRDKIITALTEIDESKDLEVRCCRTC